jgi:hypothetical protein
MASENSYKEFLIKECVENTNTAFIGHHMERQRKYVSTGLSPSPYKATMGPYPHEFM